MACLMNWIKFKKLFPNIYEEVRAFDAENITVDSKDLIIKYLASKGVAEPLLLIPALSKINSIHGAAAKTE